MKWGGYGDRGKVMGNVLFVIDYCFVDCDNVCKWIIVC